MCTIHFCGLGGGLGHTHSPYPTLDTLPQDTLLPIPCLLLTLSPGYPTLSLDVSLYGRDKVIQEKEKRPLQCSSYVPLENCPTL